MENKKLMLVVIGAALSIIMVGNVLMPVINDAVDTTRNYYNNSVGPWASAASGDNITITFDSEGYKVDGSVIKTPSYSRLIVSDKFYVERSAATCYCVTYDNVNINRTTAVSMTATISNGQLSVTMADSNNTSYDYSLSIDYFYYVSSVGDYRMVQVDNQNKNTVYFNDLNDITIVSRTSTALLSYHNGVASYVGTDQGDLTVDVTVNDVENTIGVKSTFISNDFSTTEFKFILDGNNVAASAVLVPFEVYGEKKVFSGASAILFAIPAIVLVAIAVAMIRARD